MTIIAIDLSQPDTSSATLANQDVESLAKLILSASGALVEKLGSAESSYTRRLCDSLQQVLARASNEQNPAAAGVRGFIKPAAVYRLRHELECTRDAFLGVAMTKGVDLSLSFSDYSEIVFWDMDSLRIHVFSPILTSMLNNASSGDSIAISVRKLDEYSMLIRISVSVQGEKTLPLLLQLEGEDGLSSVQQCIRAHKGKISIAEEPHASCAFCIELPLFDLCIQ